jgi:hypothetical protein
MTIKNIFNNAARGTTNFFTSYTPEGIPGGFDPGKNPEMGGGAPNRKTGVTLGQRIKKALGEAAGEIGGEGKKLEAYQSYLNTLQYIKSSGRGISLEGAKVSTRPVDSPTGRGTKIGTERFENQLENWNSRFRKFAISRYYASLGEGK